jgi:hypothetical protein
MNTLLGSIRATVAACRAPHLSLVFREMWDTAGLALKPVAASYLCLSLNSAPHLQGSVDSTALTGWGHALTIRGVASAALPPRSMVGQLPLEQHIGVRIPGGQPLAYFPGPSRTSSFTK